MQFAVPQFTDVEDKLVGPLTLKQFLMLLGTGGIVMFFWSIFGIGIIFFLLALPTVLLGIVITFSKFNGRSFYHYLVPLMGFLFSPKALIYRKEGVVGVSFSEKSDRRSKRQETTVNAVLEPAESRLRRLAYLLDQKTEEEKELIELDNK